MGSWEIELIFRLVAATVLGGIIGIEREYHGRVAGLRTQMLVSLGAAMAMVVSIHFGHVFGRSGEISPINVDPARVAYGVMGGIGFLGAGAIIRQGLGVRGLTTAASMWCTAAIGLGAGFGMFAVASAATAMVLFTLIVMEFADRKIPVRITQIATLDVPGVSEETINRYRELAGADGAKVIMIGHTCDFQKNRSTVKLKISANATNLHDAFKRIRQGAPEIISMKVE